ncbi:hypothetical protein [Corynebacterium xerosis]|uniref:Uncharacterized protein n=1 Tax=Corynebacterium xerosis TaxID=1725 RepID=A0ABV3UVF5_9CORY
MADKIDERRVREMRELIQEGGAEAVEARYPGGTRSPEYARAVRQRSAARRRAEQARERVVEEHEDRVREQQMEEKAAAEAERKKADKAQGDERPAAGRHQRDAQNWNSPPAKGAPDQGPQRQRLSGDELEAVRERMREARERIRRDDQAMAARAAKTAAQGHIHAM